MTAGGLALDPARIRELSDLRTSVYVRPGGAWSAVIRSPSQETSE
mgnify:CR=1 FL=1